MSSFWDRKMADLTPANLPEKPIDTQGWSGFQPPSTSLVHSLQPTAQVTSPKAQSSRDNSRCPECNSSNYMRPGPSAQLAHRCYDCGYPLIQSGSGVASTTSNGPVRASKQLDRLSTDGYNPRLIVDRIE